MNILLQFYIVKSQKEKFLFWSCVLETYLNDVDFEFLNKDNKITIEGYANYSINIVYNKFINFDESVKKDEQYYNRNDFLENRPEYFLSNDETLRKGSPYKHASSLVKTYYQNPGNFILGFRKFFGDQISDYDNNLLMRKIIESINNEIGINIFDNGSIPGSLSIYKKLPMFEVNGDFKPINDKLRYITIVSVDDENDYKDALIEIETLDKDKILSKIIKKYSNGFIYEFPIQATLESFFEIHITLFVKKEFENYEKIYEEKFSLIRRIDMSFGISGSYSKIVKTRFIHNKKEEKIKLREVYQHNLLSEVDNWIDWEQDFKNFLLGKKKIYLESKYFEKSDNGRDKFLSWVRNKVQYSIKVTIIDPYFDQNGVNDFFSCIDTNPEIIIITTDPNQNKRDNELTKEELTNIIYKKYNKVELYYANIAKFHDRYFILECNGSSFFYNMSNSWNGTVNNYSLLVQEVPLEIALQISQEINEYYKNEIAESKPEKSIKNDNENKENKEKFDDASYIQETREKISKIDTTKITDKLGFINLLSEPFWANYYGKIEDTDPIFDDINSILKNTQINELEEIARVIIKELLEKQKTKFIEAEKFIKEEPIGFYDTLQKCIYRINNRLNFGHSLGYELKLDYSLSKILGIIFIIIPFEVKELLLQLEQEICVVDKDAVDIKEPFRYYVSELLVSHYLLESFLFSKYKIQTAIDFASRIKNWNYPRLFIAKSIFFENNDAPLQLLLEKFKELQMNVDEKFAMIIDILKEIKKNKRNEEYIESFEYAVFEFVGSYEKEINKLRFAYEIYIGHYELDLDGLNRYYEYLEKKGENEVIKKIQNIFLFKALESNNKLMQKIIDIVDLKNKSIYINLFENENQKLEFSEIDTKKYQNVILIVSEIFADRLKKNNFNIPKNIINQLGTNKNLIFNLNYFPEKMGLYYYDIFFILNTIWIVNEKKNENIKSIMEYLNWYLPACLSAYSDDFYGMSINVIDIYTHLLEEENKLVFLKKVHDTKSKVLIMSSIDKQNKEFIEEYKRYFDKFTIISNDNAKSVKILLNTFINLCLKCSLDDNVEFKKYLIEFLEYIKVQFEKELNPKIIEIFKLGLNFANNTNEINFAKFYRVMGDFYLPYSVPEPKEK